MKEWILVKHELNNNYLNNKELTNFRGLILITYKTKTGQKHVKAVHCNYGRLSSKEIKDVVIAFMFLPDPYKE